MISISHFTNLDNNGIKSFILREDDNFICKVYWPKNSQTEIRKVKFENALKQFIETKAEKPKNNYLVCWRKVRFITSLEFLDRYPELYLKSEKMIDKFVKKISEED